MENKIKIENIEIKGYNGNSIIWIEIEDSESLNFSFDNSEISESSIKELYSRIISEVKNLKNYIWKKGTKKILYDEIRFHKNLNDL